ncbi:MAG: zinc metallopeptidase [Clostridiales bacterium]|nr:zinc metallopeptidase [Clostridiales bacterium]
MYLDYYISGIILLPAIILAIFAQIKVHSTYVKYSKIKTNKNLTGKEVAELILQAKDINDVEITEIEGTLTDYYDSKNKVLALSKDNFNNSSVSNLGVTAHECGHAIQDKEHYLLMKLRSIVIKVYNISSKFLFPLILIGIIFDFIFLIPTVSSIFIYIGISIFGLSFLLNLITLPVEFNASKKALKILKEENILTDEELKGAKKVLSAAALTYVAEFLYSLLNLIRFILIFKRDD